MINGETEARELKIVAVTNRKLCTEKFLTRVERLARTDIAAIILREKDLQEKEYEELAGKCMEICTGLGKRLILHEYINAAEKLGNPYIHLSWETFCREKGRKDRFREVGVSVHSAMEAKMAQEYGAAYVIAGHIYATDCKRGLPGRGTGYLQKICETVHIPVWAIGGITADRAEEIKNCRAAGICVMSEFMQSTDPQRAVAAF